MAREEIKLEKKLSPINVWALALGCIIGWGAFVMPGNTFLGISYLAIVPLNGTALALIGRNLMNNLFQVGFHPVTGTKIKGFEIPYFKEACEMVEKITREFNIHGYIAWDVAIAEDGPLLIEINGKPGSTLLDLPYFGTTGKGGRQYMADLVKHFCNIY